MSRDSTIFTDPTLFEAGAEFDSTAANFPCVAIRFRCNETTGAVALSADISNLVLPAAAGITNNGDGTIQWTGNISTITSGTIPQPASGASVMSIISAKPAAASNIMTLGNNVSAPTATDNAMRSVSASTTVTCTVARASLAATVEPTGVPPIGNGTIITLGTLFTPSSASGLVYDIATIASPTTPMSEETAAGNTSAPADFTGLVFDQEIFLTATTIPFQILWFFFSGPRKPGRAELRAAVAWHQWAAVNGNKWIYPGFKGMS